MTSYLEILKDLQQRNQENLQTHHELEKNQHFQPVIENQDECTPNLKVYSPNQSYIEYVPFKRRVMSYEDRVYRQRIPKIVKQNSHIEKVVIQTFPRQRIETDFYAIEHLRYYQKQIIPEKSIEYVPVVKTIKKIQYVPVQRKIIHYCKDAKEESVCDRETNKQIFSVNHSTLNNLLKSSLIKQDSSLVKNQLSPIKQFPTKDSLKQQNENYEDVNSSVLISLSKAYSRQPETGFDDKTHSQTVLRRSVSQFSASNNKFRTLEQMKLRSTETIQSRMFEFQKNTPC